MIVDYVVKIPTYLLDAVAGIDVVVSVNFCGGSRTRSRSRTRSAGALARDSDDYLAILSVRTPSGSRHILRSHSLLHREAIDTSTSRKHTCNDWEAGAHCFVPTSRSSVLDLKNQRAQVCKSRCEKVRVVLVTASTFLYGKMFEAARPPCACDFQNSLLLSRTLPIPTTLPLFRQSIAGNTIHPQ